MTDEQNKRPLIGVAVIIVKNGEVLLGKRRNSHGEGAWALPGGHLEWNESITECALREVFEETGLIVKNIKHAAFTNDVFTKEEKHYVTLFVTAEYVSGEVQLKEPHKCGGWFWFAWNQLPAPRFLSLENLLKQGFSI